MKKIAIFLLILMVGCQSSTEYRVYPVGERIVVKAGYKTPGKTIGDEFVFSVILPNDEWVYYADAKTTLKGYISPRGQHSRKTLMIEWIWIDRDFHGTQQTISESPYYFPWYSGVKGDGGRIPYRPAESQLRYGDWHRGGYSQLQFTQAVYRGKQQFYCIRAITRRGSYTRPPEVYTEEYFSQVREGQYGVYDTCPFRTTDGRDAYFKVTASFNVSDDDISANPNVIEDNLQALDEWLKPLWDSLEIMPTAYQFTAP